MANDDAERMQPVRTATRKRRGLATHTIYAGLDIWSRQLIQLISFVFIGNVIGPELVGVFGSALLYHLFISSLLVSSFSETVVQRKDITPEHQDSVLWFSLGLGIFAAVLSVLLAQVIAAAFGRPEVADFLYCLAVIYPILGISALYVDVLRRSMSFGALALRSVLSVGTAAVLAIVLVRKGFGVWSLVAFHIWWRTCELVILLIVTDWRPRLRFSIVRLHEVAHYGFRAMGLKLIGYLSGNFDRVLVGLFLGPASLGIYMMGSRIVDAFNMALTQVFTNVSLTVFSRLQSHTRIFRRAFSNATRLSNLVGLPIFVGLAVVAEPLVRTVLKPEWAPLVPILQIFCFAKSLGTVTTIQGSALRALGKINMVFWGNLWMTLARMCATALVLPFGLIVVAVTVSIFPIATMPIWQHFINRRLKFRMIGFFANFLPAVWSSAAMAVITLLTSMLLANHVPSTARLAIMVVVGVIVYFACLMLTSPSSLALVKSFLRMRAPQAR